MVHQYTNKTFINPPVNTVGDLPIVGQNGEIRLVVSEDSLYKYVAATTSWVNTGIAGTGSFFADGKVPAKADFNIAGFDLMNIGQLSSASGSQLDLLSKVTDGANAIVLNVDTINAISTTGAKLLSLKVQGIEKFAIDKDGNTLSSGTNSTWIVHPSEGGAGISAALTSAQAAGGGVVQLLRGVYSVTSQILLTGPNNVELRGLGEQTDLQVTFGGGFPSGGAIRFIQSSNTSDQAMNAVSAGATSVFTTIASQAADYLVGDRVFIKGTDAFSEFDAETNEVAVNGNDVTGEIVLKFPVQRTYVTPIFISSNRDNKENSIRNLKLSYVSGTTSAAIVWQGSLNCITENVIAVGGFQNAIQTSAKNERLTIRNCRSSQATKSGFYMAECWFSKVIDCFSNHDNSSASLDNAGINMINASFYGEVRNCKIVRSGLDSIVVQPGTGNNSRHFIIDGNTIEDYANFAIKIKGQDMVISNNLINDGDTGTGAIELDHAKRITVTGNTMRNGYLAIRSQDGKNCTISGNSISRFTLLGISLQTVSDGAEGFTITGNAFDFITSDAIDISGVGKHSVVGNTIRNCGAVGIHLEASCIKNLVSGNVIMDNAGNAIKVENTSTDNLIIGNNCTGGTISEGTGRNAFANNLT